MKKNYPRNIRGAVRRGWPVIRPEGFIDKDVSWLGLLIWTDRNAKGRYVCSYNTCEFAFELERDASWFALKWS
jgi:hypothetical protein